MFCPRTYTQIRCTGLGGKRFDLFVSFDSFMQISMAHLELTSKCTRVEIGFKLALHVYNCERGQGPVDRAKAG